MAVYGGDIPVSPGCALFRRSDVIDNLFVEIPNDDKLTFGSFGAGNDLLLFLFPLLKYSKVVYVNSTNSYFRAHKGSFSISNKLNIYYDWSRVFYLKNKQNKKMMRNFKTVLFLRSIRDKEYKNMYTNIRGLISIPFLFSFTADRIYKRMIKK